MTDKYDIGDVVTLYGIFTDVEGAQADPITVELRVRKPDGTYAEVTVDPCEAGDLARASTALAAFLTSHAITSPLTETEGVYKADVELDQSGRWRYAWQGEGEVWAMEQSWLYVRQDLVGEPPVES